MRLVRPLRNLRFPFKIAAKTVPICRREESVSQTHSTVEAVVQTYFDGLYEGDADKLGAAFHPSADLRWVEKGELKVLTVPDWLPWGRKRPAAEAEGKTRREVA